MPYDCFLQNYKALRKAGITVRKTIDVLIATFCIKNDLELIHNDKDFDAMEEKLGLKNQQGRERVHPNRQTKIFQLSYEHFTS